MTDNIQNPERNTGLPEHNQIRDSIKNRHAVDFSGATRRRLALMYHGRGFK